MQDRFENYRSGLNAPAEDVFVVAPDDHAPLMETSRALYVGGSGDVTITAKSGNIVTFANVQAGTILPVRASAVRDTGTTATDIVGLV
jgi:hypothetical protein